MNVKTLLFPFITLALLGIVYFSSHQLLDFALFHGFRLRLLTKGGDLSQYTAPVELPP